VDPHAELGFNAFEEGITHTLHFPDKSGALRLNHLERKVAHLGTV
jgi:hypothetical protein